MENLLLFIIALGSLFLFFKWRVGLAQKNLEGKDAPDAIKSDSQHPDGALYYFYHPMCGPCRQMEPVIDHLMQKYPDRVKKFNVAEHQELTLATGIKATPTTVYIKNNIIIKAIIGSKPEKTLEVLLLPNRP
jgi:thioredoxin-like negative regulator of GroEL